MAASLGVAPAYLNLWPQIARAQEHAHRAARSGPARKLAVLDRDAAEIEAIAAQIIPSDATPGAQGAGVIHFIDRALATFDKDKLNLYREGLRAAQAKRAEMFLVPEASPGWRPSSRSHC